MDATANDPPRYLFVTGKLAEFALRQALAELAPRAGFAYEVAVLPITVAALMPTKWIARHLVTPPGIARVILPGACSGDLELVRAQAGVDVERGPRDLRDLAAWFGASGPPTDYGAYAIEILAEINQAPRLAKGELIARARRSIQDGADVIDLGCDPGSTWTGVGEAVAALRDQGWRVSIDSFDPDEVAAATRRGAELVLSVNAANREQAPDWGAEVVAIPDRPGSLDGLEGTIEWLDRHKVPMRIDPILEPIGFGFAASLGRYLEARRRWPELAALMGVGNLTELTDVDSCGVNVMLAGFCAEAGVNSVLTTEVINWARTSVREWDLARRLAFHAVTRRTLPKHVEPRLVALRDPKVPRHGPEVLAELRRRITDKNWRIFAEDGRLRVMNAEMDLSDVDPFALFDRMGVADPAHAFYLGYELMKARTALTLGKAYRQDQALDWGYLTEPEISRHDRKKAQARGGGEAE